MWSRDCDKSAVSGSAGAVDGHVLGEAGSGEEEPAEGSQKLGRNDLLALGPSTHTLNTNQSPR